VKGSAPQRILVAVDDSPAALEGARLATDLAAVLHARLLLTHVLSDRTVLIGALDRGVAGSRRAGVTNAMLRRLHSAAEQAGVAVQSEEVTGEPASCLLARARTWDADLLVVGRSDVRRPGTPYVGAVTRHLLEFSECPVLVAVAVHRTPGPGSSRAQIAVNAAAHPEPSSALGATSAGRGGGTRRLVDRNRHDLEGA
jgi:nucleotide-binding universal stress UspA family protein